MLIHHQKTALHVSQSAPTTDERRPHDHNNYLDIISPYRDIYKDYNPLCIQNTVVILQYYYHYYYSK